MTNLIFKLINPKSRKENIMDEHKEGITTDNIQPEDIKRIYKTKCSCNCDENCSCNCDGNCACK